MTATVTSSDNCPKLSPTCPACSSPELQHEVGDRFGCQNCGYRIVVSDDGKTRPWLAWTTAGRRPKRKRRASR